MSGLGDHRDYRVTRRGRVVIVLVIVVVLAAVLGVAAYGAGRVLHRGSSSAKDYAGDGTGRVEVTVTSGETLSSIGDALAKAGVVASIRAFTKAATADSRATGIQPGTYALHSHMSGQSALALLLDPKSKVQSGFTVPEGASITTQDPARNILQIINRGTGIPLAQLQAAVADPSQLQLPSYAGSTVQGFLFPATYEAPPGTTAVQALQMMTAKFTAVADSVGLEAGATAQSLSPLQVVTLASIIQGESASTADAPKVARVFLNRLAAGMPLGSEFTVNYAGGSSASPYNTYTKKGIPPGPLDSPGQAAIQAVLQPATGTYKYFVTLPQEGDQFVDTEAQFFALQQKCKAEGGCKG